jgi:hypothetical protein
MNIRNVFSVLFTIALLSGCSTAGMQRVPKDKVVSPESARPALEVTEARGLTLSLLSERMDYLIGEPVYLAARLTNSGAAPRNVFASLQPEDVMVTVIVRDPSGRVTAFSPLGHSDSDERVMMELPAGATIGDLFPVFFGARGWTFTQPGDYEVHAVYLLPDGKQGAERVQSNRLTLRIAAASDATGKQMLDQQPEVMHETGLLMAWRGGDHLKQGHDHLQRLSEQSPPSLLADSINSVLAQSAGRRFMNYQAGKVRAPDCERAATYLKRVTGERLAEFLQFQNAVTKFRCAVLARERDAEQHLRRAREIAGDRPEYRGLLARIDEMEKNWRSAARQ